VGGAEGGASEAVNAVFISALNEVIFLVKEVGIIGALIYAHFTFDAFILISSYDEFR